VKVHLATLSPYPRKCWECDRDRDAGTYGPITAAIPATRAPSLPAMSGAAVDKIRALEQINLQQEQTPIVTHHLIHAGMYHRTIKIDAGVVLTGALIKRATTVTVSGDALVSTGDYAVRLVGYHVLPASAHRKQAFLANTETHITMCFPTKAKTVEEAEAEFTDEADLLFSRTGENVINITGE
jgi:hypothetical protein